MNRLATLAPLVLSAALLPPGEDPVSPPGLVLIQGGRTTIGADADEVVPIIERTGFSKLIGETPQHEVRLDDFHLMVSEVTNEQFLVYVESAGVKPPRSWAEAAINAEIERFALEQAEEKRLAKEEGRLYENKIFDARLQARWWEENWKTQEWALPAGLENHPVLWCTYEEALGYARWAGLRLMTEEEFQRAGRGSSDRIYVWGDDFDMANCATVERKFQSTSPVGSFPEGASPEGIYDLCGNVWEWTSSKYMAYPDYKPVPVKISGRKETALADWNANQRVAVSGCYKSPKEAARLTTRRASERFQSTDSLGFRCASTPTAGFDLAQAIVEQDISVYMVPEGTTFDPLLAVAMDRWESKSGTAGIDGYRIVNGYHHVLFVPVSTIGDAGLKPLTERSVEEGPVLLGIFSSTVEIEMSTGPLDQRPPLEPGTYFVRWRGRGEARSESDEEAATETEAPIWDPKADSYVFYGLEGEPVAATKAPAIRNVRLKPGEIETQVMQPSEEQRQYGILPWDQIDLTISVPGQRTASRGFVLSLPLKLKEGTVTSQTWRMSGE